MPEGYTHARCALQAAELAQYEPSSRTAFLAGSHGPDSLFFFQAWKKPAERKIDLPTQGNRMHRERTGAFLLWLLDHAVTPQERDYALGFLCHYVVDCNCHPYVYACMAPGRPYHRRAGHGYFETALDSWLHKQDYGRATVRVEHSSPRLVGAPKAQCVALLRGGLEAVYGLRVSAEDLSDAFEQMYWIRRLIGSPLGIKKALFWLVEPLFGGRGAITAHCGPARLKGLDPNKKRSLPGPWQNPFDGLTYQEDLAGLLQRTAQHSAVYITAARQYWAGQLSREYLCGLLGSRNYSSGLETEQSQWPSREAQAARMEI